LSLKARNYIENGTGKAKDISYALSIVFRHEEMKSLFNTLKLKIPDIDTDFCFISDDADFHDAFKKKHNSCDVRLVEFFLGLEQNRSLQDLVSEL